MRLRWTLLLLVLGLSACTPSPARRPNVVLIVIDTARADRFSAYGYERPTTPNFDAWTKRGILFENASSTSSWTVPSHASMFTGLYPIEHGATQERPHLGPQPATLAEIFSGRGYATFGTSGNPNVGPRTGLSRGFDSFAATWRERDTERPPPPNSHPNLRAVRKFLTELPSGKPFFLFVNYIEPHGRYLPPEPHRSRFLRPGATDALAKSAVEIRSSAYYTGTTLSPEQLAILSDLYDGEIAYADALVGGLLEMLEHEGYLENTLVVITSDHGENMGEHGHIRHVFSLYNTTVKVPLLIVLPDRRAAGSVRADPVAVVDLFTTLLSLARVEVPQPRPDSRDLFAERDKNTDPVRFAEYYYPRQALKEFPDDITETHGEDLGPYLRRLRSVERDGLRMIWASDGRHELYDLRTDPGEKTNEWNASRLSREQSALSQELQRFVAERGERPRVRGMEGAPTAETEELDEEAIEELRALGYLY